MIVKDVMRTAIATDKDVSLPKAAEIMSSKNISSLIFVKGKNLKGIVTETDLVTNYGKSNNISKIMTQKVITVNIDDTINTAIAIMKKYDVSNLPVMDKKKGLVGILSAKDLLTKACKEGDFLFG